MLWICKDCTTKYSVGAKNCPQCGSTEHRDEGVGLADSSPAEPVAEGGTEVADPPGAPVADGRDEVADPPEDGEVAPPVTVSRRRAK